MLTKLTIRQIAAKRGQTPRNALYLVKRLQDQNPTRPLLEATKTGYLVDPTVLEECIVLARKSSTDRIDRLDMKYRRLLSEHNQLHAKVAHLEETIQQMQRSNRYAIYTHEETHDSI